MSKIAYTIPEAAEATGISETVLREAQRDGDLTVHYATSRPVVLHDDLVEWIESKPTTARRAS